MPGSVLGTGSYSPEETNPTSSCHIAFLNFTTTKSTPGVFCLFVWFLVLGFFFLIANERSVGDMLQRPFCSSGLGTHISRTPCPISRVSRARARERFCPLLKPASVHR